MFAEDTFVDVLVRVCSISPFVIASMTALRKSDFEELVMNEVGAKKGLTSA